MVKIAGIGNRFMKDDGIAIKVAEVLKARFNHLNIEVIIGETDCQSCFYLLNRGDFVFILDAFYNVTEPGSIHIFKLEEVMSQPSSFFMQHDMSIIELMKLYSSKFKGYIVGIEIAEIGFGDKLSLVLEKRFQQICSNVERTIEEIISEEIGDA